MVDCPTLRFEVDVLQHAVEGEVLIFEVLERLVEPSPCGMSSRCRRPHSVWFVTSTP